MKPTILLVDDDEGCLELWGQMLCGIEAHILFARSLEEALSAMAKIPPPDLILLDLRLPPHNAEHTLEAIKAFREFNPALKVVVISGMKLDDILSAVRLAGVVVQGALCKDEELCQTNLMRVVRPLLASSSGFTDTAAILDTVNEMVAKKTQPLRE